MMAGYHSQRNCRLVSEISWMSPILAHAHIHARSAQDVVQISFRFSFDMPKTLLLYIYLFRC
jgi:hypothetical protein